MRLVGGVCSQVRVYLLGIMTCRAPDLCLPLLAAWITPLEPEASWFRPLCQLCLLVLLRPGGSEAGSQKCIWLLHLVERRCSLGCCVGSVKAVWVFCSRTDLVIDSKEDLSIWKMNALYEEHTIYKRLHLHFCDPNNNNMPQSSPETHYLLHVIF